MSKKIALASPRTPLIRHINTIIKSGEVEKNEVCALFAHTIKFGAHKEKTQTRQVEKLYKDVA